MIDSCIDTAFRQVDLTAKTFKDLQPSLGIFVLAVVDGDSGELFRGGGPGAYPIQSGLGFVGCLVTLADRALHLVDVHPVTSRLTEDVYELTGGSGDGQRRFERLVAHQVALPDLWRLAWTTTWMRSHPCVRSIAACDGG
ncbi:hypothetical protein EF879_13505 [Micromonospora sp. HM5-17]|nr:hypothetical protein EF879_13505 [Micromonospora sp. HM5-17]